MKRTEAAHCKATISRPQIQTSLKLQEPEEEFRNKTYIYQRGSDQPKGQFIHQAWSFNGKIRVWDNKQKIHTMQQESDLYPFGHTSQPAE